MKRLTLLFVVVAIVGITVSAFAAGSKGFVTPNEAMAAGYTDVYVRANAGEFLSKGDVIFVKAGLNPTISGFVLVTDPAKIQEIISMINNSADPNLSPITHRQAGLIGYSWGSGFKYNAHFNRIEVPAPGGSGDKGSGNDGSGQGGGI